MKPNTTYAELGEKISRENKTAVMAQLTKYRHHVDEDGAASAPTLIALDNLQSAVVLMTGILKADGAETGEIIEYVTDRVMRSTVRHLERILKVNIQAEVLSMKGPEDGAEASEHNAKVVADIMKGIMGDIDGAKH